MLQGVLHGLRAMGQLVDQSLGSFDFLFQGAMELVIHTHVVGHRLLMRSAGLILLTHRLSVAPLRLEHIVMSTLGPFLSCMHTHAWPP